MNVNIDELKSLAKKAGTRGWVSFDSHGRHYVTLEHRSKEFIALCRNADVAAYIAAAHPTAMLLLLETIELQAQRIGELDRQAQGGTDDSQRKVAA